MTPAETMTFILMHRPGATSGSFRELPASFSQVTWEEKTGGVYTNRSIRVQQGEPVKTLRRRIHPVIDGTCFLEADVLGEFPVGDDVGAAILQALDGLFMET